LVLCVIGLLWFLAIRVGGGGWAVAGGRVAG
jgi:hypothetical protein